MTQLPPWDLQEEPSNSLVKILEGSLVVKFEEQLILDFLCNFKQSDPAIRPVLLSFIPEYAWCIYLIRAR